VATRLDSAETVISIIMLVAMVGILDTFISSSGRKSHLDLA